jgi:hypothetical protein
VDATLLTKRGHQIGNVAVPRNSQLAVAGVAYNPGLYYLHLAFAPTPTCRRLRYTIRLVAQRSRQSLQFVDQSPYGGDSPALSNNQYACWQAITFVSANRSKRHLSRKLKLKLQKDEALEKKCEPS